MCFHDEEGKKEAKIGVLVPCCLFGGTHATPKQRHVHGAVLWGSGVFCKICFCIV